MASPMPRLPPATSNTPALIDTPPSHPYPLLPFRPPGPAQSIAIHDRVECPERIEHVEYVEPVGNVERLVRARAAAQPAAGPESAAPASRAAAGRVGLPHAFIRPGRAMAVRGIEPVHVGRCAARGLSARAVDARARARRDRERGR